MFEIYRWFRQSLTDFSWGFIGILQCYICNWNHTFITRSIPFKRGYIPFLVFLAVNFFTTCLHIKVWRINLFFRIFNTIVSENPLATFLFIIVTVLSFGSSRSFIVSIVRPCLSDSLPLFLPSSLPLFIYGYRCFPLSG